MPTSLGTRPVNSFLCFFFFLLGKIGLFSNTRGLVLRVCFDPMRGLRDRHSNLNLVFLRVSWLSLPPGLGLSEGSHVGPPGPQVSLVARGQAPCSEAGRQTRRPLPSVYQEQPQGQLLIPSKLAWHWGRRWDPLRAWHPNAPIARHT